MVCDRHVAPEPLPSISHPAHLCTSISANTDGNVSKLHEEVLIFSMMRAVGSFARTIVMMSEFFRVITPSWAKANETHATETARARRTDNRDLHMGDPFKIRWITILRAYHFEGLEVQPYSTDCRVRGRTVRLSTA